jgi:hypothetical protein
MHLPEIIPPLHSITHLKFPLSLPRPKVFSLSPPPGLYSLSENTPLVNMNGLHARLVVSQWEATSRRESAVTVDGKTLDLAKITLVGRHKTQALLTRDEEVKATIDRSVKILNDKLDSGETIYGQY